MAAALLLSCVLCGPDGEMADGADLAEQVRQMRQETAVMGQELRQLTKDVAALNAKIDDMPKSYVPRAEHDLRDHQLDMIRADIERRVASNEAAIKVQGDRQYEWLWDMLKMFAPAALAGGGVGLTARLWRNREVKEEEHKRRRAENTVGLMKEIIKKTKQALQAKGINDVPLPDYDP